MYQIKRSSDPHDLFDKQTKKLRTEIFHAKNNKFTCIEHLSNELFYEIFEYLDGNDIYQTFFNLNSRFQHLITYSSLPLKIKLHSKTDLELIECFKNVIIPARHRIVSLDWEKQSFITDFFTHYVFDSSFVRLQSLIFREVSFNKSMVLLFYLKTLPCLSSLTMEIYEEGNGDLRDIYRLIFSLSFLKYMKLSFFWLLEDGYTEVFVPLAANEQLSSIEHLVIDHRCTDKQLFSILQHTPRLRHLTFDNLVECEYPAQIEQAMMLSNLACISFDAFLGDFDEFKMCMAKLSTSLEVLIINNVFDDSYLDANQWERFILRFMPRLRKLQFTYADFSGLEYDDTLSAELINRFASPFWFERQCFFQVKIKDYYVSYSILPYKNIWLDIYKHAEIATFCNRNIGNDSNQHIQLNIERKSSNEPYQSFLDKFTSKFEGIQFTRLNINCEHIPIGMFIRIIQLLPNLDSLKVSSLPLIQPDCLFDNDGQIRFLISINNKITKVNLEKLIDVEQVHFILYLSLRIEYLQVDVPQDIDVPIFLRCILAKIGTYILHLKTLCLSFLNIHEEIKHRLDTLIESEKLLTNYMLKCIGNHIVLKWH